MNHKIIISSAFLVLLFGFGAAKASIVLFDDKTRFLSDTQAIDVTGEYPNHFQMMGESFDFGGEIRFSQHGNAWVDNYSNLMPGNELSWGYEYFTAELTSPSFSFGFDIHEQGTHSDFDVVLYRDEIMVDSFAFVPPKGTLYFVGVWSDTLFNRITVQERVQNSADEIFGQFYAGAEQYGGTPNPAIPTPGSLLLMGIGVLGLIGYRRKH